MSIATKVSQIQTNATLTISYSQSKVFFDFGRRITDELGIEIEDEEALDLEAKMVKLGFAGATLESYIHELDYNSLGFELEPQEFLAGCEVGKICKDDVRPEIACAGTVTCTIFQCPISDLYVAILDVEGEDTEIETFERLDVAQSWATENVYEMSAPE
jgi:hypothetical protein